MTKRRYRRIYNSGPASLTKGTTPNSAAEYLHDFVQ